MKSFLFIAALLTSGAAIAQALPRSPTVAAPVATVAGAVVDQMSMKPAAQPVTEAPIAAPAVAAQPGPVAPCSKTVHDGCMNSAHTAMHGTHAHASHHARHHKRPI
jgi:hypothetical protein